MCEGGWEEEKDKGFIMQIASSSPGEKWGGPICVSKITFLWKVKTAIILGIYLILSWALAQVVPF